MVVIPYLSLILILVLIIIAIFYLYAQFLYSKMTIKSYLKKENYLNEKTFEKYSFTNLDDTNYEHKNYEIEINSKKFKFEVYTHVKSTNEDFLMLLFDSNNRKYKAHKYIANDNNYKSYIIFDSLSYQKMQYLALSEKTYDEVFTKIAQQLQIKKFDLYVNANFASIIKTSFENAVIENLILENVYFDPSAYIEFTIDTQLPLLGKWQKKMITKYLTKKISKQSDFNNDWSKLENKISKVVKFKDTNYSKLNNLNLIDEVDEDFPNFVSNQLLSKKLK